MKTNYRHALTLVLVLMNGLLTSCLHSPKKNAADTEKGPTMYRPWKQPPPVDIETALAKAMSYLRQQRQNLSSGYVLEAARDETDGENCWWFKFELLPLSPDAETRVRVYDSGKIDAFPLAPPRAQAGEPAR